MLIEELERLTRAATPGPWRVVDGNRGRKFIDLSIQAPRGAIHESLSNTSPVARTPSYGVIGIANATYIAAFNPVTALKLLAVVKAAVKWGDTDVDDEAGMLASELELSNTIVDMRAALDDLTPPLRVGNGG